MITILLNNDTGDNDCRHTHGTCKYHAHKANIKHPRLNQSL